MRTLVSIMLLPGCLAFTAHAPRPVDLAVATSAKRAEMLDEQGKWSVGLGVLEVVGGLGAGALIYPLLGSPGGGSSDSGSSGVASGAVSGGLGIIFVVAALGLVGLTGVISGVGDVYCGATLLERSTTSACADRTAIRPSSSGSP